MYLYDVTHALHKFIITEMFQVVCGLLWQKLWHYSNRSGVGFLFRWKDRL